MTKPLILVVALALINDKDEVLTACRPAGKHMAGHWEFPGGKVEPGETPEAALVREIREELDIEINEADLFPINFVSHSYEKMHLLMPLFGARVWRGNVTPREGQTVKWVARTKVKDLQLVPADIALIPALEKL